MAGIQRTWDDRRIELRLGDCRNNLDSRRLNNEIMQGILPRESAGIRSEARTKIVSARAWIGQLDHSKLRTASRQSYKHSRPPEGGTPAISTVVEMQERKQDYLRFEVPFGIPQSHSASSGLLHAEAIGVMKPAQRALDLFQPDVAWQPLVPIRTSLWDELKVAHTCIAAVVSGPAGAKFKKGPSGRRAIWSTG